MIGKEWKNRGDSMIGKKGKRRIGNGVARWGAATLGLFIAAFVTGGQTADDPLRRAIDNPGRTAAFAARDGFRHPYETLGFFGIRPDMQVVELWPGGGWYSEILATYLREGGKLVGAHFDLKDIDYYRRGRESFDKRLAEDPLLAGMELTTLSVPVKHEIAAAASADMVLTFRNLHNWLSRDAMDQVFVEAYRVLKPGGTFGVVEHRAAPDTSLEVMKKSGYVTSQLAVDTARQAGFELVASSEINANPRDTKDHPGGVWTLPPSLRLKDKDREKYLAIGESDRMTLLFRKPE